MTTNIEIREIFQDHHDAVSKNKSEKVLISHCGVFSTEFIRGLADSLSKIATSYGESHQFCTKLFSILLEGLKNLKLYAEPDKFNNKVGFLIVSRTPEGYNFQIANLVTEDGYVNIEKYLNKINDFTQEELYEVYNEILTNELLGSDGKKGRGFVNARIKTENKIDFEKQCMSDGRVLLKCYLRMKNRVEESH